MKKTLICAAQPRYGVEHFGPVVADLDATVAALQAQGVRILREPLTIRPGRRIAFIEGPDRVRIELVETA